jgi:hypothetical protein
MFSPFHVLPSVSKHNVDFANTVKINEEQKFNWRGIIVNCTWDKMLV